MDWKNFNTDGMDQCRAFEAMCNQLFERWCRSEYAKDITKFTTVNGAGGDGGVEAYAVMKDGTIVAVQTKWFREPLTKSQFDQIKKSIATALRVRPNIKKYIVCIPRDLTSTRIVKGNRRTNKSEDTQWDELISEQQKIHSELKIELWNESRIFSELRHSGSEGIRLYWFKNSEISKFTIENAFSKAKYGWAKTSYVSALYSQGMIHEVVTNFVGSKERAVKAIKTINIILDKLSRQKWILRDLMAEKNQVASNLEQLFSSANGLYEDFCKAKDMISNGENVCKEDIENIIKKHKSSCIDPQIYASILNNNCLYHEYELRAILRELQGLINECIGYVNSPAGNKLIITGDPGTGKTCGIVGEIDSLYQEGIHLAFLVHASDFQKGKGWKDIITSTLGLSTNWEEKQLFQALEAAAYSNQFKREHMNIDEKPKVQSNIIICVDGLDECYPYSYWEALIGETTTFKKLYNRIKFVFLSRPYALGSNQDLEFDNACRKIPNIGDVDLGLLFDKYIEYFKIDLGGNYWIKEILDTPLSVKLFCEIYKNNSIKQIAVNSLIVTTLFQKKIDSLESEYNKNSYQSFSKPVIHAALISLSKMFSKKREISYEDIAHDFSQNNDNELQSILSLLSNHGFIYERKIQSNNILCVPESFYSWGMQPAMDYLVASQLKQQLDQGNVITEQYEQGVYQMLALLLLEENGKLLSEYTNLLTEIKDDDLYESICYALSHANYAITKKYCDYTYYMMAENPVHFRQVVNRIVLPCTRVPKHPLGISLLDKYLRSFRRPVDRDIWWSIPSNLSAKHNAAWTNLESVDFENYPLKSAMSHEGYPLLYVWLLSTVDNRTRYKIRIFLTRWGIDKQDEFISLFKSCVDINDPQIKADLFSISYGIALSPKCSDRYLKKIGAWIISNVFCDHGLRKFCDADIRYYCRGIIDISVSRNIYGKEAIEITHPPYHIMDKIIAIDVQAASSVGADYGYSSISYYLDRYVLMGSFYDICNKYGQSQEFNDEANNLLDSEKKAYGLKALTTHGFVISAAYKYLLNQGWDENRFRGDEQQTGIDVAIEKAYNPATHGVQSTVMSVGEKYVWCAKSKIMAFFADITKIYDGKNSKRYLDDYAELTGYENPYQDSMNELNKDRSAQAIHIRIEDLHNYSDYSSDSIYDFMKNTPLPDFDEWISKNNSSTLMYSNTVYENGAGGMVQLYISSGLVEPVKLNEFLSSTEYDTTTMLKLLNVCDFTSKQSSHYCSPSEICAIEYGEEKNEKLHFSNNGDQVPVFKAISKCVTKFGMDSEKEFVLPSKLIREAIGIKYGDGYQYYNKNDSILCEYKKFYIDSWNKQDYLMVKSEELKKGIEKLNLKVFWLFRIVRRATRSALERFPDIKKEFDHTFLVWYENNECKYKHVEDNGYKPTYNIPFSE